MATKAVEQSTRSNNKNRLTRLLKIEPTGLLLEIARTTAPIVLTTSLGMDPGVSEEIIAGALHPYPPDLVIATKGVPAFRFQTH